MRLLRLPAVLAVTLVSGVSWVSGGSCTKRTGPELDAQARGPVDARGSGTAAADGGVPRDGGLDAGTSPSDAARRDAAPDAMPDAPLGP